MIRVTDCRFHGVTHNGLHDKWPTVLFSHGGTLELGEKSTLTNVRVMPDRNARFGSWGERLALWLLNVEPAPWHWRGER